MSLFYYRIHLGLERRSINYYRIHLGLERRSINYMDKNNPYNLQIKFNLADNNLIHIITYSYQIKFNLTDNNLINIIIHITYKFKIKVNLADINLLGDSHLIDSYQIQLITV